MSDTFLDVAMTITSSSPSFPSGRACRCFPSLVFFVRIPMDLELPPLHPRMPWTSNQRPSRDRRTPPFSLHRREPVCVLFFFFCPAWESFFSGADRRFACVLLFFKFRSGVVTVFPSPFLDSAFRSPGRSFCAMESTFLLFPFFFFHLPFSKNL